MKDFLAKHWLLLLSCGIIVGTRQADLARLEKNQEGLATRLEGLVKVETIVTQTVDRVESIDRRLSVYEGTASANSQSLARIEEKVSAIKERLDRERRADGSPTEAERVAVTR